MNKNFKITLIAVFMLCVILIIVFVKGVSFGVAGKFFFTTKYYNTATEAFLSDYSPTSSENNIEIENQVDIIAIDKNNCILLATTKSRQLLVASMITKGDKFAFTGDYYLYDLDSKSDYKDNVGLVMNKTNMYDSKGKLSFVFEWGIVFNDEIEPSLYEKLSHKDYSPKNYKRFVFIFE